MHHLRSGTATPEDWSRITRVDDRVRSAPIVVSDEQVNTLTQIKALCRRIMAGGRGEAILATAAALVVVQGGAGAARGTEP
ncbi:hypothetical protein ABZT03_39350 [Streptomyces sp. NPDC005574]|uniref:hypothetical protein n=1 Tax=Streptomyces sp. NPDC005574 TaxID=3156891 RepID=UPI0033AD26DE